MKKYLLGNKARPLTITQEQPTKTMKAAVTVSFREGEVFLRNEAGRDFRLIWRKGDTRRKRYLPAGKFRLNGYRIIDGDWFISSAAGQEQLSLAADKTTTLDLPSTITLGLRVFKRKSLRLMMTVTGYKNAGLSIYHKGQRIPMPYLITDAQGKELCKGTMEYG